MYDDPDLELGHVLDLQLHEFSNDVEEICDQAQKEEKMEMLKIPLGLSLASAGEAKTARYA